MSNAAAKVAELEARKAALTLEIAKLEAKFEERGKLAEEWSSIHRDHKDTIAALLDALKNKAK
jgi:hypothetical protein